MEFQNCAGRNVQRQSTAYYAALWPRQARFSPRKWQAHEPERFTRASNCSKCVCILPDDHSRKADIGPRRSRLADEFRISGLQEIGDQWLISWYGRITAVYGGLDRNSGGCIAVVRCSI